MAKLELITLNTKPTKILTTPLNAILAIAKINIAGGRVTEMVKVAGQHRRWRLSIRWQEPKPAIL
ncbi:MAG TPA: hypothetical protein VMA35_13330 [Candidatus Sulfopaludibacter sp.]|nr:hypothetical protein [Candidatus Sulfopaludibacter sp.]